VLVRVGTAKLRSGPGEEHKTAALLDKGRDARVVGRKGDWVRLRLESGREGWVRSDLVVISKAAPAAAKPETAEESDKAVAKALRARRQRSAQAAAAEATRAEKARKVAQAAATRKAAAVAKAVKTARTAKIARAAAVKAKKAKPAAASHVTPVVIAAAPPKVAPMSRSTFLRAVSEAERVVKQAEEMRSQVAAAAATIAAEESEPAVESLSGEGEAVLIAAGAGNAVERPRAERLVSRALAYRGTPYRMGATGNGAFDCSGFTQYLFGTEGERLPRTAAEQYTRGLPVAKEDMQPGDLVFFKNTYKRGVSHVGIYIGNNSFVHASSGRGRGVTVTRLDSAYYINHWAGARRPR
jgi:cell wall-associated NlpC family hydrolase